MRFRPRRAIAAAAALTLLAVLAPTPASAVVDSAAPVFINELHYDNDGTDVGEFVEVAGPAGTDLSGWSIVLYNGNGGAAYGTVTLDATIDDEGAGFGTVSVATAGLQNGDPDGLALVDPGGSVVEFLSYEGSFTAVGGAADGSTSTDIGVSEQPAPPVGQSLQRTGTGTVAGDFAWQGPAAESPGAINAGQTFAGAAAGPVVSEIMQNPAAVADASGEWFEISNPGSDDVDINGWTISDNDTDSHVIVAGGPLVVPAGGSVILGNNDDEATNGGATVDYDYGDNWFLANGADEVVLTDALGAEIDRVEYDGGPGFPDPNGASMILGALRADNNVGANWCTSTSAFGDGDLGTPGAANDSCDAPPPPPPAAVAIHDVQGTGPIAALAGQTVTVQGVVTSLFENVDVLDGFFLQEEDADADADPATSEGIFIFCRQRTSPAPLCPSPLAVGDQVTVTGQVTEFFGMSQIDILNGSSSVDSSGNTLPAPTGIDLPAPGPTNAEATYEAVEGMLVSFTDKLVVSEYFELARYGQLVLTADARPDQFTDANPPSVAGYAAFLDDLATRRIILDDDNNNQNDATTGPDDNEPYPWPAGGLSTTSFVRGGDSITGLTGVIHWSFAGQTGTDAWRIRPVDGVDYTFTGENPRPDTPPDVGGTVKVASFNVLNYFATIDDAVAICGPSADLGCRGADSAAELTRQRDKIVSAIAAIDADVVGLIEIENDGGASVSDLVAALNGVAGAGTYDFIDTGTIGTDAIKVAFIYQPASVSPVGDFAILDSTVDPAFIDTKNRPVLIQTFEDEVSDDRFTVAVNHLKSKGSACDDVGDPGLDDGQANCNLTRTAAAEALATYLATDPTGSGDDDFLIIGDLNAYAMEDPITALKNAGYTDLVALYGGPGVYSYVFDGQLGYLDHALANAALLPKVTGVAPWHINADEIPLLDYNDDVADSGEASFERESSALDIYDPDPYRSSDHDPVVIGLELGGDGGELTCDGLVATIVGTERRERIVGTSGDDVIVGLGGDDLIVGLGGNDVICGGDGDDLILGNSGMDVLSGGEGDDNLWGGSGADSLFGGEGDDVLRGGGGDDDLDGGEDTDVLQGNGGTDTCINGEKNRSCER